MKKKIASTTLALTLIAGSVPVFAQESTQVSGTNTTNVTTTVQAVDPDSLLYKLKELLGQIKLVFTFDDQAKADLLIQQANEKIAELESLNQNGKVEYNDKFIETINETLAKAQEILKEAKVEAEAEQNTTAKTEIEQKEDTTVKVEKHSLVVLKALLEKVPEQGKKGIQNAITKQEAKLDVKTTTTTQSAQSTGTQASTSTEVQANVNVQVPEVESDGKEKHDNGLHLGQIINHEKKPEKDKQEHDKN